MFDLRKKKKNITIYAPIAGTLLPLEEVHDPTFSQGLLGEGFAIRPAHGRVVAPINGTVTQVFSTGHAITITSTEGAELLIHVGLETVALDGKGYVSCVKKEDPIHVGDVLMEFDINTITEAGFDLITPVVICNSSDFKDFEILKTAHTKIKEGEEVIRIRKDNR
ncbi:MAG: PTS glucose transporter subunit IIA [Lachnospiraceae bacterium]|nr:PTS glucose transporter subunit IIA [Lachnospiraceae bacterium]